MSIWARADFLDEYAEDGEGVVLLPDGRVVALSPVAWSVVSALSERPAAEAKLVQLLVDRFGVPEDEGGNDLSVKMTVDALEALGEAGVVTQISQGEGPDRG